MILMKKYLEKSSYERKEAGRIPQRVAGGPDV